MDKGIITIIGLLLTNAGFLFGMWKYFDGRFSRVYGRLDEVKNFAESTYVRRDNCAILHNSTADNLRGMEMRFDDRLDKLDEKIENNFKLVMDMIRDSREK
jgi:hypothetical protein